VFMKNWEEDDTDEYCAAAEDLRDAQDVCDRLGIPLHAVNFSGEYWERVFKYFLAEYQAGRTPNPDVLCNTEVKFKAFLEHALDMGADHVATGHYARVDSENGRYRLLKGADPAKDQTYFLHGLNQQALSKVLFPIGSMTKTGVRALAKSEGLPVHDKKDSTGICFIGERKFKDFLLRYISPQPGEIRSLDGELKGHHDGLMFHTIGQRHGLGIGGPGEPWYVVDKDMDNNVLLVAQGTGHPALYQRRLVAADLHWIAGTPPRIPMACAARIRYRQMEQPCGIVALHDRRAQVAFSEPQRAPAPGQSIVFYQGEECLGGGLICALGHHAQVA